MAKSIYESFNKDNHNLAQILEAKASRSIMNNVAQHNPEFQMPLQIKAKHRRQEKDLKNNDKQNKSPRSRSQ